MRATGRPVCRGGLPGEGDQPEAADRLPHRHHRRLSARAEREQGQAI